LIKIGNTKKSVIEGAMSQIILFENSTAFVLEPVSIYIHVIANMETKGMAAKMAPSKELLFAISDMSTISTVVIISLII